MNARLMSLVRYEFADPEVPCDDQDKVIGLDIDPDMLVQSRVEVARLVASMTYKTPKWEQPHRQASVSISAEKGCPYLVQRFQVGDTLY